MTKHPLLDISDEASTEIIQSECDVAVEHVSVRRRRVRFGRAPGHVLLRVLEIVDRDLEDTLGLVDSPQVSLSEREHRDPFRNSGAEQGARRFGEDDLPSVAYRTNASRAHDVETDVTLLVYRGLAGVQSHAHADGFTSWPVRCRMCTLCFDRSRHSVSRAREGEEECVSLGIDLDAVVLTKRATNDSSVRGQDCGIPVAEPLEQFRRVLDVGEDERHRSSRRRRWCGDVLEARTRVRAGVAIAN